MCERTWKKCTGVKSSGCGDGSEAPAAAPERSRRVNLSRSRAGSHAYDYLFFDF